jgi:3D (Asp-Asp-Asp) domain-containing protein
MYPKFHSLIVLSLLVIGSQSCASISSQCSPNWKVTGYYTPVETDYQGTKQTIDVADSGSQNFDSKFIKDVRMEGWGKTRHGWYLGYYGQRWHKSEHPKDAYGRDLTVGVAAADPKRLSTGKQFYIKSEKQFFKEQYFVVRDVGQKIKNKHIDIYTGEGTQAKYETWNVTGHNTICML